jgi:hypothetical protein
MDIHDFLYVDLNKVISLYSQMTGGIVDVIERSTERSLSADNKRNYDFKLIRHDAGGTAVDSSSSKMTIKPHHAFLKELEDGLLGNGFLVDLTDENEPNSLRDVALRSRLKQTLCVKVRGRAVIEDYERLKGISSVFPEIVKLINKSSEAQLLKSSDYATLQDQLANATRSLKQIKDRNERSNEEARLRQAKNSLEALVASASRVGAVDQWILDGLRTWVEAFLPGIVNLRVYPDVDRPDEHVFGHLKKTCFEDVDSSSLHFTYGSFPTEELTMIGIVTSIPEEGGEKFKPLAEFDRDDLIDHESVERGFRGLFRGFDGFEQMIRTCRFPRVLVHPLTVYRSVSPKKLLV